MLRVNLSSLAIRDADFPEKVGVYRKCNTNKVVTKVTFVLLFFITLGGVHLYAQSGDKLMGNKILSVQKGGIPDKVYTRKKPRIRVATYNIGKNAVASDVSDFSMLNAAIK